MGQLPPTTQAPGGPGQGPQAEQESAAHLLIAPLWAMVYICVLDVGVPSWPEKTK